MTSETVPNNFLGIPDQFSSYEKSAIAVLPLAFDLTSSWLKGADRGPAALINASQNLELYDIETESEPYEKGIFTCEEITASSGAQLNARAEEKVQKLLADGKFVVTLGGEHSISLGPIRAHHKKYPELSVLQLDAHTDMRPEFHGDPLSHASIMARASEFVKGTVAVGIRSLDREELGHLNKERVFFAEKMRVQPDWKERAISLLSKDVYLTFDLDVFDPSIMPSTGTPEPGGLLWYETLEFLRMVFERRNVVGADVVELLPGPDRAPEFLAAKLVYKLMAYKFCLKK